MKKLAAIVDRIVEVLLVLLMAVMVVVVSWQVATRYLLNDPSSITEELATYLLIWISLIGAAYALRRRAHLGIDILVRSMSPKKRRIAAYAGLAAVALFALLVLVGGGIRIVYVTLALKQISAALRVPIGYVYLVLPLSGLLMTFYALVAATEIRRGEVPPSGEEDRVPVPPID
ncbi:TRAP transporter small permease [Rhodocaloribacter litoris]|uniref:TRAP transporter small permease n=1 Tax=Rhodocaloribacter litoris TaxID=2558931 RepID=UPI001421B950|nr:TRAP transporter small permease [Rhodocaloribacter litoris]QXD14100.1 TRAP transporter small permease [Rhodocaloribacter litoris]